MDEWQTLTAEADSALAVFDDLSVSTSVVILALVALGIGWIVRRRRVLAARRAAGLPSPLHRRITTTRRQTSRAVAVVAHGLSSARVASARAVAGARHSVTRTAPALMEGARRLPSGVGSRLAASGIRADRAVLAGVAAAALLVLLGAVLAAGLGRATGALALGAFLVALGSAAGLRVLAVRERVRRRAEGRPAHRASTRAAAPARAAAATSPATPAADPERDRRILATALSLSEPEARTVTPESAAAVPRSEAPVAEPRVERTPTGSLVIPSVPRPTYLDAPEMERPAPAPFVPEQAPSSQSRIKAGYPPLPATLDADTLESVRLGAEEDVAALDLDRVLARRRAS